MAAAVPRRLAEDDFWGRYFARRDELINHQGSAVRAAATRWTPQTAPAWAVPTLSDANLTRDLAVWRAARDIPDTDLRPTGPPTNDRAGSHHQRQLDRRVTAARDLQTTLEPAVTRLAETIHPGITADPHWPTLADHIAAARQAGIDRGELRRIATARPLPIEQPAAAFAYRLIDAIGERPTTSPHARPPKPTAPRPYEPRPLPMPPPHPARTAGWRRPPGPVPAGEQACPVGAIPCHIFVTAAGSAPTGVSRGFSRRVVLSGTKCHRIPRDGQGRGIGTWSTPARAQACARTRGRCR